MARDKSTFGKGDPIGVIASEASNNARDGAFDDPDALPWNPGGPEMAILLGSSSSSESLRVRDGPRSYGPHRIIIVALMLGNVLSTIISITGAKLPLPNNDPPHHTRKCLHPAVCFVALYSANTEIWDFVVTGVLCYPGHPDEANGYPLGTVVIG